MYDNRAIISTISNKNVTILIFVEYKFESGGWVIECLTSDSAGRSFA